MVEAMVGQAEKMILRAWDADHIPVQRAALDDLARKVRGIIGDISVSIAGLAQFTVNIAWDPAPFATEQCLDGRDRVVRDQKIDVAVGAVG